MKIEITLRIADFGDGRWKFDIKPGMNDDEIRKLLGRMKFIENELKERMETDLMKVAETVEFLRYKKKR